MPEANTQPQTNNDVAQVNPLDVKEAVKPNENSQFVDSIVANETKEGEENILGAAPEVDMTLLEDAEPPKSILLTVLKIIFTVLVVAGIGAMLFFNTQLTKSLEFATSALEIPSIVDEVAASNEEIVTLQTDVNFYRYLQIKGYIDRISYFGDIFSQNYKVLASPTATNLDKGIAKSAMDKARAEISLAVGSLTDEYAKGFFVPVVDLEFEEETALKVLFEERLREKLSAKAGLLLSSEDVEAMRDYKNFVHTVKLVGNDKLKNTILAADFSAMEDNELNNFIKNVNALIINDVSIIQEIKEKRIKWSDVINEIDLRTIAVDSYYSDDFYDELGGIRYSSYDFDSENRRISIVGETKRFDTTNFTMIANLIDEINNSPLFEGASMRSFSKSGSLSEGYTATLKLVVNIEDPDQSDNLTENN